MNTPKDTNVDNKFGLPREEFRPMETTSNRKWLRVTLLIAGVVLVSGATIVWWLLQSTFKTKLTSLYYSTQISKEEVPALDASLELEMIPNLEDDLLADLQKASPRTPVKQEPIINPTIETIHAPTGLYHVIAASCIDHDLVMDYAKKLLKKGCSTQIIMPRQPKHFVRLSIAQASTWKEAAKHKNKLQAEFGNKIWIMRY